MPSVGSWRLKNGAANTAAIAAARPACVISVRMRRPAGARATHQTTNRSSGSPAVTLTSAPSVSAATASISRRASTNANAPATASATSRSLCPLATDWNRTTGFIPNAATANAARDGRTRRAVVAISASVPRLAASAVIRNTWTCAHTESTSRTTTDANPVNNGP